MAKSVYPFTLKNISNSYTMVCPPVRGENPLAKASGFISHTGGQTVYYFIPPSSIYAQYEIDRAEVCDFC